MKDRNIAILEKVIQYADEISGTLVRFDSDIEIFKNDYVMKNAIAMCILQIGELVNMLTEEFKIKYNEMPWRDIISMRHRTVHAYGSMDMEILWKIVTSDIPELKNYCESVIKGIICT